LGLRRWHDAGETSVDEAVASYHHWWAAHFGRLTELTGLAGESNQLRYRAHHPGVMVRVTEDGTDDELAKALGAAAVTGTPLRVSSSRPLRSWPQPSAASLTVESTESFVASVRAMALGPGTGARLRLLGKAEPDVQAAAAEYAVTVLDEPLCSHGRVELVRWLREQVVTRSLHRYGNIVYAPFSA